MEITSDIIDNLCNDFLKEVKELKKFTYKKGISESILAKFLTNRFSQKYKLYVNLSQLNCDKIYNDIINISCNFVTICFPYESIIITCSYSDAMRLSGINNILIYDKTFIQFKIANQGIICKSGPIIICKLPLESIIYLNTNKQLIDLCKGKLVL